MKKHLTAQLAALTLLVSLSACAHAPTWQEQYDLGVRYLSEGNYEEAIIAFTTAIEIDPKRADSYFGRGQAYQNLANRLEENSSITLLQEFTTDEEKLRFCYGQALQDYERAIELSPDTPEYYDMLMLAALEYGDMDLMLRYGELKYQNTDDSTLRDLYENASKGLLLMNRLAEAFSGGTDEDIFLLMQGDSYQALLNLQEYLKRPILREYNGKTLGLYRVDDPLYGHCMIYYGDCADGIRSGTGAWYGYYGGNNYASRGDWSGDAPNGSFETKEWYSGLDDSVVFRLVSGEVRSGLWNGPAVWAFQEADDYAAWDCTFENGVGVIVDQHTMEDTGITHYFWSTQSQDGIRGSLGPSDGEEHAQLGIAGFLPV